MYIDEEGYLCIEKTVYIADEWLIHLSPSHIETTRYKVNSKGLFEEVIDNQ